MISFSVTKQEREIIKRIADRAVAMAAETGPGQFDYDRVDAEMDITATHANDCPLRLRDLLSAEAFDFAHDVFGIRRHLNRQTGKLDNYFLPRFAK